MRFEDRKVELVIFVQGFSVFGSGAPGTAFFAHFFQFSRGHVRLLLPLDVLSRLGPDGLARHLVMIVEGIPGFVLVLLPVVDAVKRSELFRWVPHSFLGTDVEEVHVAVLNFDLKPVRTGVFLLFWFRCLLFAAEQTTLLLFLFLVFFFCIRVVGRDIGGNNRLDIVVAKSIIFNFFVELFQLIIFEQGEVVDQGLRRGAKVVGKPLFQQLADAVGRPCARGARRRWWRVFINNSRLILFLCL
mmetsp:Transcript_2269/g.3060  ORF Transcript_2269/g.3060 Transcript_2269/m.3060 type:complete len:243 (+) Transcript_2269:411-1139(+)